MSKATLVIMAAGMGSRYGGLKQIDPVGKNGEIILDYSVYDAIEAGFDRVIFVIKHEIEDDFKEIMQGKFENKIK
ncbi:MAG: nucleotidyltransferase, partial [Clostridia bacterium]|nr:nucleotidyltransferase [Clostridia bacterium]